MRSYIKCVRGVKSVNFTPTGAEIRIRPIKFEARDLVYLTVQPAASAKDPNPDYDEATGEAADPDTAPMFCVPDGTMRLATTAGAEVTIRVLAENAGIVLHVEDS